MCVAALVRAARCWPRRRAAIRGACLGALLGAAGALPARAQAPTDSTEVLSVSFSGAEQLPEELLRTAVVTAATQCTSVALQPFCWLGVARARQYLDPRILPLDLFRLRAFYYQRGFREARIALDTTRTEDGIHVLFRIHEGRPVVVTSVQVEGASEMGGGLTRRLPVRAGDPLSMIEFEATRDTLRFRLANRGYAAAEVLANYEIRAEDSYSADVVYELIPGPLTRFGAIEITGTERVSPAVVRRMLLFRPGDLYSRQALLRSQRNLFSLEVFRHAEIVTPVPAEGDSVLPVVVRVNEGDLHQIRLGLGISTADYLNAEGRWISRNFLGRARRLELRGRVSNLIVQPLQPLPGFEGCSGIYCDVAGSLALDFSQPWFFDPLNTFGAGAFVERLTLPGVYVRTSRGGYVSVRRLLGTSGAASIGYRPEVTQLESDGDLIFCVNFVACEEREIDVLRRAHWLAPIAASLAIDRSNSLFAPTGGYVLRLDGEYASDLTASEFGYVRLVGEISTYHDPFRGVVIASRLRPGWTRAVGAPGSGLGVHPQKPFFAGGPNSVRGFAQYRLGPKLLTVNAAERLADTIADGSLWGGCSAQTINAGTCDATELAKHYPGVFEQRPVGGAALLEGNLEVRFPIWAERLRGAAFLDFGQVWQRPSQAGLGSLQWTPGVGIRYFSPIGPIRIDVGYNPAGAERLTVITTEVCHQTVVDPCAEIQPDRIYAPDELANRRKLRTLPPVVWRPFDSFFDRLQLHFSIGQAF